MNFSEISDVFFENVSIQNAKSNYSFITGKNYKFIFVWSELQNSTFGLFYGSSIHFYENILDGLILHPDYLENGYPSSAHLTRTMDERLNADYPKLRFERSSLRCAQLAYLPITSFEFDDVDISGAYFDFDGFTKYSFHEAAWSNLKGAWYYSDNPPTGIPSYQMENHLFSRDRQTVLDICKKHEPRAFAEDPLGRLSGPDGIEMTCVSLARAPDKCVPYDPFSPFSRISSLFSNPEDYGLEH